MRYGADPDRLDQAARFGLELIDQRRQGLDLNAVAHHPHRATAAGVADRLKRLGAKVDDVHRVGDQHLVVPMNDSVAVRFGV